ncbi:Cms1p PWA37_002575 [Arxiozyma heterogenica]|uniref:Protein CMS1 n=1 Tax=Arxiozyma heterogenica TaxID=278026 RepID=A0AAN7WNE3_9SACH|nr:hypothetical protein RI543_002211 [Kazachstania heterogenica]
MSNPDDLDDGLVYDFSGQEDNSISDLPSDNEVGNMKESDTKLDTTTRSRKRDNEFSENDDRNVEKLSKRQKKLQNSKFREKKKEKIEYEINQKKLIPRSNTDTISEYFIKLIRSKNPNLSALELDNLYLKKNDFISTEPFKDERDLNNLAKFIINYSKAPNVIIFSMSNKRIADVFRQLGGSKTSVKLFAKNKLDQDITTVTNILNNNDTNTTDKNQRNGNLKDKKQKKNKNSSPTPVSSSSTNIKYFIATPTRMEKILASTDVFFQGKDKLDIILDASYLDNKSNSLISFENTMTLCKVLKTIIDNKSSVKILLY